MKELPENHVGTTERARTAPRKADHVAVGRLCAAEFDRLVADTIVGTARRGEAGER
ncbi:hypothetical protein IU459_14390 [Nocardia amamiensis]|uniref:Uncharacterized protein n=1 Tax=Nocardia amamiensis TaxID=404578 RepID=A0ABS0CQ28_9NOCA|nr:hypothetical protein [Nocardia amamiensis]MBF6298722.1 hypothetical protein [Nocardia amamiensis]